MAFTPFIPSWFSETDIMLEVFFALAGMVVAFFAFSLYRTSQERSIQFFGISFLLIATSYLLQAIFDYFAFAETTNAALLVIPYINGIGLYIMYAYTFLMITGLVFLAYLAFSIQKPMLLGFLVFAAIIAIAMSGNPMYTYFALSSLLIVLLVGYYVRNYLKSRKLPSLLVVLAFSFLLFGNIHFLFSVDHGKFYVFGRLLELVAYTFILATIYFSLTPKATSRENGDSPVV